MEQGDSGPFGRFIRSQKQDNVGISPLNDGGKLHTDSIKKAEILSNQFKSVFTHEDTTAIPHIHGPDYPTIPSLEVAPLGVTKLLNGINPKKAQGPDEIPCRILKEIDNELTPAVTAIFNQSLETGELPLVWTEAIVTPIYKKGDRNLPENYRPISLTCVCCKLLEHIICTHIRHHLDTQNILSKLQHGLGQDILAKETAYLSLVRPTLEYAASVWDPHLIKYRNSLEAVQRKAARFVYGDYRWRASPTHMLKTLGWKNLEARRRDSRLNLMYNITHNITAVSAEELGMVAADGRTKANHHFKF